MKEEHSRADALILDPEMDLPFRGIDIAFPQHS